MSFSPAGEKVPAGRMRGAPYLEPTPLFPATRMRGRSAGICGKRVA